MAVHYDDAPNEERAEVVAWIESIDASDFSVSVGKKFVSVHGKLDQNNGVTVTKDRRGNLTLELASALADLRDLQSRPDI